MAITKKKVPTVIGRPAPEKSPVERRPVIGRPAPSKEPVPTVIGRPAPEKISPVIGRQAPSKELVPTVIGRPAPEKAPAPAPTIPGLDQSLSEAEVYKMSRVIRGSEPDYTGAGGQDYLALAKGGATKGEILEAMKKEPVVSSEQHKGFYESLGWEFSPDKIARERAEYGITAPTFAPTDLFGELLPGGAQPAPSTPLVPDEITTQEQIKPYLEKYQEEQLDVERIKEGLIQPKTEEEIRAEITGQLPGIEEIPKPPELLDLYEKYMQEFDVLSLETSLNDLKAQEEEIYAQRRLRKQAAEGAPVALGVIAGRVSEIERQENERIDFVRRQKQTVIDELNTKYSIIQTMMNLTTQDYNNARVFYETKFNQAIQTIKLISGQVTREEEKTLQLLGIEREEAREAKEEVRYQEERFERKEIRAEEREEQAYQRDVQQTELQLRITQASMDAAKANLQVMVNAITDGGVRWENLTSDQRLQINKLETMAGLPNGLISNLKTANPESEIISTSTIQGLTQVLLRSPTGEITVQTFGMDLHEKLIAEEKALKLAGKTPPKDTETARIEQVQQDFMADVMNPGKLGIEGKIATGGEEGVIDPITGESDYVTREELIRRLQAKWGRYGERPEDIEDAVYYVYPG